MPVETWLLIPVDAELMARGISFVVLVFVILLMTGYFCITLVTLLSIMITKDLVAPDTVLRAAIVLPVFAAAAWIGARYFRKSNDKTYTQVGSK